MSPSSFPGPYEYLIADLFAIVEEPDPKCSSYLSNHSYSLLDYLKHGLPVECYLADDFDKVVSLMELLVA